jgi:hypothetical protein
MALGALYRHRRFAGVLAFFGMAFYAVLVPCHTLSQTTLQLAQTSAVSVPCYPAMADEGSKPSEPDKPRTRCPRIVEGDAQQAACEISVADAHARTPQSRGPPFFS